MEKKMELTNWKLVVSLTVNVVLLLLLVVPNMADGQKKAEAEVIEGTLSEISDGVYAQTYSVYSDIPANNTQVAVICTGSQVYTLKGRVEVHFTEDTPRYTYTKGDWSHFTTICLYVPRGTVQQLGGVTSR